MTSPSTRRLGLAHLPVELLEQICSHLCLHCRCRHVALQPTANVVAWYQGQKALARLSRTCRFLRRVAQPILFHWYHAVDGFEEPPEFRRFASFFLATLSSRNLATAVKSLALHNPKYDPEMARNEEMRKVRASLRVPFWGTHRHILARLRAMIRTSEVIDTVHLQDLALVYLPRVSELSLSREFRYMARNPITPARNLRYPDTWFAWRHPLPALRHLFIPGRQAPRHPASLPGEGTVHIALFDHLLHHAPNLQTLNCADASGSSLWARVTFTYQNGYQVAARSLPRLRRLSISGIGVEQLAGIVARCPMLEDIEFFDSAKPPSTWRPRNNGNTRFLKAGVLVPAVHLKRAMPTLKRLCYSVINSSEFRYEHLLAYPHGVMNPSVVRWPTGFSDGLSFATFPVLQCLEVEQLMLHGPLLVLTLADDDTPDDLIMRRTTSEDVLKSLPPNLVWLRVGRVDFWPVVMRDLVALSYCTAEGGGMYCPQLKMVHLEVSTLPPESEHRFLAGALGSRGVSLSMSHPSDSCEAMSRGILPPRPGAPTKVRRLVQFGNKTSGPGN